MTAANFAIIPAIANQISDKRKLMDAKIWIAAAIGLLIILGVIAYNMYQENQYRRQVREQFGHADKDALLESQTESVRDGKTHGVAAPQGKQGKPLVVVRQADVSREDAPPAPTAKAEAKVKAGNSRPAPAKEKPAQTAPADLFSEPDQAETAQNEAAKPLSFAEIREQEKKPAREKAVLVMEQFLAEHDNGKKNTDTEAETKESVLQEAGSKDGNYTFASVAAPKYTQEKNTAKGKLLMDLDDMVKQELPWFEPRFDYMAYISLSEPQEFRSLPRFSGRHRFQIAGCTMDGVWQTVEPVPNIYYQGFIVALQAISRKGLATVQELEAFGSQRICRQTRCRHETDGHPHLPRNRPSFGRIVRTRRPKHRHAPDFAHLRQRYRTAGRRRARGLRIEPRRSLPPRQRQRPPVVQHRHHGRQRVHRRPALFPAL